MISVSKETKPEEFCHENLRKESQLHFQLSKELHEIQKGNIW